jgi:hypothetical protein
MELFSLMSLDGLICSILVKDSVAINVPEELNFEEGQNVRDFNSSLAVNLRDELGGREC